MAQKDNPYWLVYVLFGLYVFVVDALAIDGEHNNGCDRDCSAYNSSVLPCSDCFLATCY